MSEILFNLNYFYQVTSKYRGHRGRGPVFLDADRQVATVVVETARVVWSLFNVVSWELNKLYPY